MNESGRQTNTFIQTSPLPLHSLCHWGLERGDGRLTRGVDLGHFAFWDGINPLMPSSIRLPAPLGTIGKQIFIGLLEKKKAQWILLERFNIFVFRYISLCSFVCDLGELSLSEETPTAFSPLHADVWWDVAVWRRHGACWLHSYCLLYHPSLSPSLFLHLCLLQSATTPTSQKLNFTSLAWWGAAVRREHTLTAVWDHEAVEAGSCGSGPGVATGHRDSAAKRHSRHGNTSGPGKSRQLVTK